MLEGFKIVFRSGWGWPAVLTALAASAALCFLWSRPVRAVVSRRLHLLLTILQIAATLFLALWLVNPRLRYTKTAGAEGGLAVLVDGSLSMGTADVGTTRFEAARKLLFASDSPLRAQLRDKAALSDFTFHSGLQEIADGRYPDKADPTGTVTDIAAALEGLAGEVRSRRLQGVVLASDGSDTGKGDLRRAARDLGVPVYAIGIGTKSNPRNPWRNVGIARVDVPTQAYLKQEVEVKVRLAQEGFGEHVLPMRLTRDGQTLDVQDVALSVSPRQVARFKFTPTEKGTQTLTASLTPPEGDRVQPDDALSFSVMVTQEKIRVLYAEGALRLVYKFVRRVLEQEETVQLDCVVRTGGGNLYVQSASELRFRGILPAAFEDLAEYAVVILGDLPKTLLSDGQIHLLDRFVKEKKGGLLVIGGPNLLHSGDYRGGPLETLLPVRLSPPVSALTASTGGAAPEITSIGRTASVLSGLETVLPKMRLTRLFEVGQLKGGAEVWVQIRKGGGQAPVLVTQRYGEGRTMLLTNEEMWRMTLQEKGDPRQSPTARFWIQAVRWLAQREDAPDEEDPLLMACTDKSYYEVREPVQVRSKLRKPSKDDKWGRVRAEVRLNERAVGTLELPEPDPLGWSRIEWTAPHDGHYELVMRASQEGKEADAMCRFSVGSPARELERNDLDEALLRDLARESGGGYFTPLNAQDIPAAFERNALVKSQVVEKDLTNSWPLFLLFCAIVSAGWILRRRKNLI